MIGILILFIIYLFIRLISLFIFFQETQKIEKLIEWGNLPLINNSEVLEIFKKSFLSQG